MAEAVIVNIAREIITSLVPQALEKVGKLWYVDAELKALRESVSMLLLVLDHAEELYHQKPHIRVWVENLKDAFYEAQDMLEEFNIETMRRELRGHNEKMKAIRTFFSSSNQLAFKLKMNDKVRAVRERIQAIKAEKQFHLDERPMDSQAESDRRKREETHSFIREEDIIGRDDDKKKVKEFLLDSETQDVSILPIVGIGGLGKTALAQFVFNDEMVTRQFNLKMWVCVSIDFDMKKIVKNIIACATENAMEKEPEEVSLEQLQRKMRAAIDGKRYLLVLDDLWDESRSTWLSLKTLLLGGARGSKILITTRLPSVAEISGTAPPHLLGGLSESASLDLLMQIAYRKEEEMQDPEMVAIAKEIVRKCVGVPLVVRTVGSLLFFKKTKLEWLTFKDYELPDVSQREDNIISVLRLSYDYLPSHLKQCFAFCSLFPKDYEIKKQTVVNLWVAEGFIQPLNRSQHLEDIAHGYFMDLLWSNFFQDFQEDKGTCKMHDLMHDLACSVAGTECWVAWDHTKSIHERTRHVSYGSTFNLRGEILISCSKASALRTLLHATSDREMESTSKVDLHQLIQSFKRLRVLDLHTTYVEKVPRSICKLKHLTYLDLSYNNILKTLPNSITRLQSLQTLNLSGCHALEELPRGIKKLVSLRNLYIDYCPNLGYLPCGLGQLSSLHSLTRFILPKDKALAKDCCELGELKGFNNIRGSLSIENLESVTNAEAKSKTKNLIGKHFLESLALKWDYFNTDDVTIVDRDEALLGGLQPHSNLQKLTIDGYNGESFPRWMMNRLVSSLPNLVEVRIFSCGRCKSLPPLGQLPHLKTLDIQELTELEYIELGRSSTSIASFPRLLELNIRKSEKLKAMPPAPHLEMLKVAGAHPALIENVFGLNKLKHLEICFVESLECVPEECWKSLTSLEKLDIYYCRGLTSLSKAPPPHGTRRQSNPVDLHSSDSGEPDLSNHDESSGGSNNNHLLILELHSLRSVTLVSLPKLASLPQWLLQLSDLEDLSIRECKELDIRKDESGGNNTNLILDSHGGFQNLRSVDLAFLPKIESLPQWLLQASNLECLRFTRCDELDICKDESGNLILDFHGGLHHSLRSVFLCELPKLASLPQWLLQASNLEDLEIWNCKELDLCKDESGNNNNNLILDSHGGLHHSLRIVRINDLPKITSLPQWLLRASNLEDLQIENCYNLKALPEQIEALQSLQRLRIRRCPSLTSLPEGMGRLASLTHLYISNCKELESFEDESVNNILDFHGALQNLRSVDLSFLPKLASLPQWLLQASDLEHLTIGGCDNLKALPEQIEALQSLRWLSIQWCPSLTSLPEGMRRLASLTHLMIIDCPELERRCRRDAGEDWHKISHIPDITHRF